MNFDCQHQSQEPFQIWEKQASIVPQHTPAHDIFTELLLALYEIWQAVTQTELRVQSFIIPYKVKKNDKCFRISEVDL